MEYFFTNPEFVLWAAAIGGACMGFFKNSIGGFGIAIAAAFMLMMLTGGF